MLDSTAATELVRAIREWVLAKTGFEIPAGEIQGHSNLINNNQTQAVSIRFELPADGKMPRREPMSLFLDTQALQAALNETKIALEQAAAALASEAVDA